jgi:hypothetical protein
MRVRLPIERATPEDLQDCLRHAAPGRSAHPDDPGGDRHICDHAQGNPRA